MSVGPVHRLTTACLEGQQQVPPGAEHPHELGEGVTETLGGRVDDRVPTHDTGERSLVDGKVVEAPFLELDTGMGDPRGREHRRRHIQPYDVEAMRRKKSRHAARSASDVGDTLDRSGCHEVDERREQRVVDRRLRRRAELSAHELDVPSGRCVVDGSGRRNVVPLRHPLDTIPRCGAACSSSAVGEDLGPVGVCS